MRKKIRNLAVVCLSLLCSLFLTQVVFADSKCGGVDTSIISCTDGNGEGMYHILALILDIFSIGVGILGVVGIMWTGVQVLTASGDPQRVQKARNRFFQIVIGLVCYVVLFGLTRWLLPGGAFTVETAKSNANIAAKSTANKNKQSKSSSKSSKKAKSSSKKSESSKATKSEKNRENMIKMKKNGKNVTIVGDSITCKTKAASGFKNKGLKKVSISCKGGKRTFKDLASNESGETIIKRLISQKKLKPIVVIALGSNDAGPDALSAKKLQELVDMINKDGKHSIYFLTNYSYSKYNKNLQKAFNNTNNKAFDALQKKNKNVMVIDWAGIVGSNPKKLMADYVHPKDGIGTDLFAYTIYRGLTGQ